MLHCRCTLLTSTRFAGVIFGLAIFAVPELFGHFIALNTCGDFVSGRFRSNPEQGRPAAHALPEVTARQTLVNVPKIRSRWCTMAF
tara:strand:- start:1668 stop:1925 length:258 start_codon:yes stop_codon:yes gene_type:complete